MVASRRITPTAKARGIIVEARNVSVVAATYHDDRIIGGLEGVTVEFHDPAIGASFMAEADVATWYSLAQAAHNVVGRSSVEFGAAGSAESAGHLITVRVEFEEPFPEIALMLPKDER